MSRSTARITVVASAAVLILVSVTGCSRGGGSGEATEAAGPGVTEDSVTIGITTPLSGPLAGPGTCTLAGLEAYFGAANADGGITFGDGLTRTVKIKSYDDAYDPAKAVANFQQMEQSDVFAAVGGLGTGTNLAIMPNATADEMPQVFVQSGSSEFSKDREANPYTIGWAPTYFSEGEAFGNYLAQLDEPLTVAILAQNDDFGADFVEGLNSGIEGSDVEIVAEASYEPTDTSVDAQVTELAGSNADVFFDATTLTPLAIGSLVKAQSLGWLPQIFLPSTTSAPGLILEPGGASVYPKVFTTAFAKSPLDPAYADDEQVTAFVEQLGEYASSNVATIVPQCVWAYGIGATLAAAFERMQEPTRAGLMKAIGEVRDVEIPLLLPAIEVDATVDGSPPVTSTQVQVFDGTVYVAAESEQ